MLNKDILNALTIIQQKHPYAISNAKQFKGLLKPLLKDLLKNEHKDVVRWLNISITELDDYNTLVDALKIKDTFAKDRLMNKLVGEGAAKELAEEVIGYLNEIILNTMCPVCNTVCTIETTQCTACNFVDQFGIARLMTNPDEARHRMETVIMPYHREWQAQKRREEANKIHQLVKQLSDDLSHSREQNKILLETILRQESQMEEFNQPIKQLVYNINQSQTYFNKTLETVIKNQEQQLQYFIEKSEEEKQQHNNDQENQEKKHKQTEKEFKRLRKNIVLCIGASNILVMLVFAIIAFSAASYGAGGFFIVLLLIWGCFIIGSFSYDAAETITIFSITFSMVIGLFGGVLINYLFDSDIISLIGGILIAVFSGFILICAVWFGYDLVNSDT